MLDKQNIKQIILHLDKDRINCRLEMILKKKTLYKNYMRDSIFFKCSFEVGMEKLNRFNEFNKN